MFEFSYLVYGAPWKDDLKCVEGLNIHPSVWIPELKYCVYYALGRQLGRVSWAT